MMIVLNLFSSGDSKFTSKCMLLDILTPYQVGESLQKFENRHSVSCGTVFFLHQNNNLFFLICLRLAIQNVLLQDACFFHILIP